jgi:putative acetyltransferase
MSEEPAWTVRREEAGDADGIDRALRRAFGGDNAANLVRRLRSEGGYDPVLSWVAVEGGHVLAHVLFSPIAIVGGDAPAPALALGPLGVMPDAQRQGVGTAIVRAGLEACREAAHAIVLVLGDPAYYGRFGFRLGSEVRIDPPDANWAPAFLALGLTPNALSTVRGTARYPAAFDDV